MKYRLAIFDFDGTLADSFPFFVRVFNHVAEQHAFRPIAAEEILSLRHLGAREMMAHVGMPAWKLPAVARTFTRLMQANAAEVTLFDGVSAMLSALHEGGVGLAVVSSNAADNVRSILGTDIIMRIGQLECGMSIFGKADRIRKVLRRAGVAAGDAIYIGDQVTDLEAARKARVAFGAVAWGYGTAASLAAHAPDELFERVADIARIA